MRDIGFSSKKMSDPLKEMKSIFSQSIKYGFKNPPVRWVMLAAPFTVGVSFYIFYALQPFLLELYGDKKVYWIAGLAAALVALAQIVGGLSSPYLKKVFNKRTNILLLGVIITILLLISVSFVNNFWVALLLIFLWGIIFAGLTPIHQTYINGLIPSKQRATVLSFDSLMGSSGGIFTACTWKNGRYLELLNIIFTSCYHSSYNTSFYISEKAKSDIIFHKE